MKLKESKRVENTFGKYTRYLIRDLRWNRSHCFGFGKWN